MKTRTGDPWGPGDRCGRVLPALMLHADHTYDKHPWHAPLVRGERRGLGAELRVFGVDPTPSSDARASGARP